ncbi:HAD hydrolase family protein [Lacticaseibacillus paracasei]
MQEQFIQDFPEMTFYRNSHYTFEDVNHGVTKGGSGMAVPVRSAVLTWSANLRISATVMMTIPLLQAADTGIAMGNAYPKVAAVADYQTDDYRENGIPNALAHFNLI